MDKIDLVIKMIDIYTELKVKAEANIMFAAISVLIKRYNINKAALLFRAVIYHSPAFSIDEKQDYHEVVNMFYRKADKE